MYAEIGTLRLTVEFEECDARYNYTISSDDWEYEGNDLSGGTVRDDRGALRALAVFLSAAAESYAHEMRTGEPGENSDLFPPHVTECAYENADELAIFSMEEEF